MASTNFRLSLNIPSAERTEEDAKEKMLSDIEHGKWTTLNIVNLKHLKNSTVENWTPLAKIVANLSNEDANSLAELLYEKDLISKEERNDVLNQESKL